MVIDDRLNPEQDGNDEDQREPIKEKRNKDEKKKRKRDPPDDLSKTGICYISRIPPKMDQTSLRHKISQYGEIGRIFLSPSDPSAMQGKQRKSGGAHHRRFSGGWVEFMKKSVAKRVASMLNGTEMGGKRGSYFFYDIWNIKYLKNFKWDDLVGEIAHKSAVREKKMAMEIAASKRERNFTLSKFAQSRALDAIEERLKKKGKKDDVEPSSGGKIYRKFSQNQPLHDNTKKGKLSKEVLEAVFSKSSS